MCPCNMREPLCDCFGLRIEKTVKKDLVKGGWLMADTAGLFGKQSAELERAFFDEHNQKLLGKLRELEQMKETKANLSLVSGIKDEDVLTKLVGLGVKPEIIASLAIIPLIEVAWADGEMSEAERDAVLKAADSGGVSFHPVSKEIIEEWLKQRPDARLLDAWVHYIEGLKEHLPETVLQELRGELLGHAREIAAAAGGFLGFGSISDKEKEVICRLEGAFK